jgi:hypothetical protein
MVNFCMVDVSVTRGLLKNLAKALAVVLSIAFAIPQAARADFALPSDAYNFAVLYEGNGGHNLQITNVTVNGNIGVGGTGAVQFSGPGAINGSVEFVAANGGQFHNTNGSNVGPTGITYNNTPHDVAGDLTSLNSRSTTLGGETGTALSLGNGSHTVDASTGTVDGNGNEVFTVSSFSDNNGDLLTIDGKNNGRDVVFNFASATQFNGAVVLTGGLTPDQVLFNITGGSVQINTNASSHPTLNWQGIILDPNGTISATNANIKGRLFGGDSNDMQIVSGTTLTAPTPEPSFLGLLSAGVLGLIGIHQLRSRRALRL